MLLFFKLNTQIQMSAMCCQLLVGPRRTCAAGRGHVTSGCADPVSAVCCIPTRLHYLRLHQRVAPLHRVLGTQWNQAADIWWTSGEQTNGTNRLTTER